MHTHLECDEEKLQSRVVVNYDYEMTLQSRTLLKLGSTTFFYGLLLRLEWGRVCQD